MNICSLHNLGASNTNNGFSQYHISSNAKGLISFFAFDLNLLRYGSDRSTLITRKQLVC